MDNLKKEYIEKDFYISIKKEKGRINTSQEYMFSEPLDLLVAIASMTEKLISKKILKEKDIIEAVQMGAKKANERF